MSKNIAVIFNHLAESDSETVCNCRPHRKLDQQTVFLLRVASPTSENHFGQFHLFLLQQSYKAKPYLISFLVRALVVLSLHLLMVVELGWISAAKLVSIVSVTLSYFWQDEYWTRLFCNLPSYILII